MTVRTSVAAFGVLALAFGALTFDAALADNGKSNGQGATRDNSAAHESTDQTAESKSAKHTTAKVKKTKVDKGGLASELKGMNAVNASPNALEHASPNSQVGRIAAYRDAALARNALQPAIDDAQTALDALPVPTRDLASIDAEIGALDPAAVDYADALLALQNERAATVAYGDAVVILDGATLAAAGAQATEDAALLTASKGRILSAEAIAYIRAVLNL